MKFVSISAPALALLLAYSPATGWAQKNKRKPSSSVIVCESEAENGQTGTTSAKFTDGNGKKHVSLFVPTRGNAGVSGEADCEKDDDLGKGAFRCEVKAQKGDFTVVYVVQDGKIFVNVSPYMSMEIPTQLTCK